MTGKPSMAQAIVPELDRRGIGYESRSALGEDCDLDSGLRDGRNSSGQGREKSFLVDRGGGEVTGLEISRQLYLVGWDLLVSVMRSISSGGDGSLP